MKRLVTLAAAVALVPMGLMATAVAEPQSTPNGPWPGENSSNLAAIHSYEELWDALERIENHAKGAFDLSSAPLKSNTGREIPVVTVGDGPTSVMYVANQHGNEYVVSEAMINLVRNISGNSPTATAMRDALTVTIVPRVNVDGFDADVQDAAGNTTPWRQNYDPSCTVEPCDPFYEVGRGYDMNRYHSYSDNAYDHPYLEGDDNLNPVPESIAMRLLWEERKPELVMDFHHQGTYVDEDGRMITGSTMWPNALEEAEALGIEDEFAETITRSQRAVSVMLTELEQYGYANITRYPSTTTPGIARNAYGLLGSASVLFEMRGGIDAKSNGYITKTAEVAGMSVLEAVADGSWETTSLEPVEQIRERGDYISDPHE
ncbi:M14 family zinc carboxypeptidase [Amycolatopsis palatopharyngis]|uniref:M14 family zinc carboxypeptidase n=1 Tax=Amycolatopsis palatopharyngis TaxID=187982 RepID=UPI000E227933|nr:M14 family zinc carboxypeptidase [Amycolatopsis palatopharyngis]